jgi:hypothetical protein
MAFQGKETIQMIRNLLLCVVTLGLCAALWSCGNSADSAADEVGVPKGRRPVPAETRKPPGPPDASVVTEEEAMQQSQDTGDDDEG